ncbi:hypothetical protein BDY24DRAFT_381361 [Mrakia frigida]|uniref:uncharacterized protein n=1 Tax=Mrakia frigida TaxID=29902 RepID=UPI003FCC262C
MQPLLNFQFSSSHSNHQQLLSSPQSFSDFSNSLFSSHCLAMSLPGLPVPGNISKRAFKGTPKVQAPSSSSRFNPEKDILAAGFASSSTGNVLLVIIRFSKPVRLKNPQQPFSSNSNVSASIQTSLRLSNDAGRKYGRGPRRLVGRGRTGDDDATVDVPAPQSSLRSEISSVAKINVVCVKRVSSRSPSPSILARVGPTRDRSHLNSHGEEAVADGSRETDSSGPETESQQTHRREEVYFVSGRSNSSIKLPRNYRHGTARLSGK